MKPNAKPGPRPSMGPGAKCAICGKVIVWAMTDTGRKMPVDIEPVPDALFAEGREGNLVLWFEVDENDKPRGGQFVSYATDEQRRDKAIPLWRAHFVTCTDPARGRGRARP